MYEGGSSIGMSNPEAGEFGISSVHTVRPPNSKSQISHVINQSALRTRRGTALEGGGGGEDPRSDGVTK